MYCTFYATYEELKPPVYVEVEVVPNAFYATYEELKQNLEIAGKSKIQALFTLPMRN